MWPLGCERLTVEFIAERHVGVCGQLIVLSVALLQLSEQIHIVTCDVVSLASLPTGGKRRDNKHALNSATTIPRVSLEKLTLSQLDNEFSTVSGNRICITVFTVGFHMFVSLVT